MSLLSSPPQDVRGEVQQAVVRGAGPGHADAFHGRGRCAGVHGALLHARGGLPSQQDLPRCQRLPLHSRVAAGNLTLHSNL